MLAHVLVDADVAPTPGCRCASGTLDAWPGVLCALLVLATRRR